MTNYKKQTATVIQPFTYKEKHYKVLGKKGKPVKFTGKKEVIDALKQQNLLK